ncbi:MAG: TetR/AcrR family transcriptional regulator [Deltaproteobacteria bacterium]|nr:TetR/AcrR family transcriptional regulator [Deltaproteobacteria bacterium]
MSKERAESTKKIRELRIRDEAKLMREEFMLEQARRIVSEEGLHALTLPRLTEVSGYSKPTVYKYFPTKEDLNVALAVQSTSIRIAYYERALTFQGRPREKRYGIHSLNFGVLRDYFRDMLNLHINRINRQAKLKHQRRLNQNEERIIEIAAGIVREAAENGDLKLPVGVDEYQIVFTLSSTTFGGYVMKESDSPVMKKWFNKIRFMHGTFGSVVLDGIGWRPLSSEWDYTESLKRFYREVFPELEFERRRGKLP